MFTLPLAVYNVTAMMENWQHLNVDLCKISTFSPSCYWNKTGAKPKMLANYMYMSMFSNKYGD